ncbi:MAG: hypothetical protein LUO82_00145 [Methanomicrobiales archaeon]|nr:hypothetical protein [Methanomicrobiales archaeon]
MEEKKKRTTGVTGLDLPLAGGFPFGESIIVYGHPLSGVDHMARQFWNPEDSDDKGTYLMLDEMLSEEHPEGMIDGSKMTLSQILAKMDGSRIILDSLSTLILRDGTEKVLDFLRNHVRPMMKKTDANVMFTLYKDLHDESDIVLLMREADVFVELREQILGNEVERTFWIRKIKGLAVPQRVIPFLITEKGLELSTTSRVI